MEIIKLNLIPSGVNPTCHCSQYDEGRVIRIELFDGLTPYTLQSGDTVTLNVRKPDNTIVTTTVETTQGNNYVDIVTTEQICACVGYNLCDLTITNGSKVIGTLNFIMAIERDVLADGIESQSVIEDLDERVVEAVGDNYYTKEETEELIDNELKDVYPLGEASGAIASFNTGVILPLKSLTAEIKATETGSGEKSPSNPYTINGFDNGIVTRCDKNFAEGDYLTPTTARGITITPSQNGLKVTGTATSRALVNLFKVGKHLSFASGDKISVSLWFNGDISFIEPPLIGYYANGSYAGNIGTLTPQNGYKVTWTVTENYANDPLSYLRAYIYVPQGSTCNFEVGLQIEKSAEATAYSAYKGITTTFDFKQTIYGGRFQTDGNELITCGSYTFDGTETAYPYGNGYRYVVLTGKEAKTYGTADVPNIICNQYKAISRTQIQNGVTGVSVTGDTILLSSNSPAGVTVFYELVIPIENYNAAKLIVTHNYKVFNGSEDWHKHATVQGWFYTDNQLPNAYKKSDEDNFILCNIGAQQKYDFVTSLANYSCAYGSANNRFVFRDTDFTEVADFTALLAQTNMIVCYKLIQPLIIAIDKKDIYTLLNENNIFTNTNGNVDVIYHHALTAKNIYFDNTGTALQADNVEDAIKEILSLIQGGNNSRALNLSKGSLKVEAPVSNEEPAIEEDPTTEEETATEEPVKAEELTTEEEPEEISDSESEPTSDEER